MSFPNTFHHDFYPFQNKAEIDRVRKITKDEIVALNGKHPTNPNIRLDVIRNDEFEMVMIADMVKRIVDLCNGHIAVESQLKKGSVFIVRLPTK